MAVRVGILSDTHGVIDADVLSCLSDCAILLHAGDIGPGVLDTLRSETSAEVLAVAGNNDIAGKWPREQHGELAALEESLTIKLPGGVVAMEHGHRIWDTRNYHKRLRARHPSARLVVYGHTHVRVIDTGAEPWVVNPGAAGRERTKGGPSCLVLDAGTRRWSIDEYRFPPRKARSAV